MSFELLQILACPICTGELIQSEGDSALHCRSCCRDYPVVEGVPVLLPGHIDTALLKNREV